jgi:hypothetical protein
MRKSIEKDIWILSKGITNVYTSRWYKRRVCIIVSVVLSLVSICVFVIFKTHDYESQLDNDWGGQVIIIEKYPKSYDVVFEEYFFPRLASEFDISKAHFEKKANVSVYSWDKSNVILDKIEGEHFNSEGFLPTKWLFYIIVLDEDGNILSETIDNDKALVDVLKESCFADEYETETGGNQK